MAVISLERFKVAIAPLDGAELRTLKQAKPFRIRIVADGLLVAPASSGKERLITWSTADAFLKAFIEKGSLSPSSYPDSFHKSYMLALLKAADLA